MVYLAVFNCSYVLYHYFLRCALPFLITPKEGWGANKGLAASWRSHGFQESITYSIKISKYLNCQRLDILDLPDYCKGFLNIKSKHDL